MARFQLGAEMAACFGYDLDTSLYQPSFLPVGFESIERHVGEDAADAFNGLDDVGQAWNERTIRH